MSREQEKAVLWPNEQTIAELDGVVPGYTKWSGLGGIVGVVLALTVPRVFNLGLLLGAVSIVAVITVMFSLVYYVIGRRLAAQSKPPSDTPYVTVLLTDKRVLLLDRGLGGEDPKLIEEAQLRRVSTIRYEAAGMLVPQRLGYVIRGTEHREFEFPRSQPVKEFVEYFD
ncbi:MAG: hypothetical protein GY722_29105 [bacterium]|nr:hypothetical protein [bacterium]